MGAGCAGKFYSYVVCACFVGQTKEVSFKITPVAPIEGGACYIAVYLSGGGEDERMGVEDIGGEGEGVGAALDPAEG